jgi:hypothetical protein
MARRTFGDLPKTAAILQQERARTLAIRATLVLTTNQEPDEGLIREVSAAARAAEIEVDLWPVSRLAHFLDFNPQGQWIRRQYLAIEAKRQSGPLLHALSRKSSGQQTPRDSAMRLARTTS